METVKLEAQKRDTSVPVRTLRLDRKIPAVFYGKGKENMTLYMDYQTFRRVYIKAGSSTLIDLNVDGKSEKVLVQDVQFNPISGSIEHVDLKAVDLTKPITADIPVVIVGEAPAVKDLGGVLNTVKHTLQVKCLPTNIPHDFQVDISGLAEFSDAIHISDIEVQEGVEILDNPEDVVAIVNAPRVEAEPEPEEVEGEEGEGGEAKEGEEGAEGEGAKEGEEKGEEKGEAKEGGDKGKEGKE